MSGRVRLIDELRRLLEPQPFDGESVDELILNAKREALTHLRRMRAEPHEKRAKHCSPRESAERIFGDAALDSKIAEYERQIAAAEGATHA